MSITGNYKSKLPQTNDPILRLYGMRLKGFKKDFDFYDIISKTFGFAILKRDVAVRNFCRSIKRPFKGLTFLLFINYFVQFLFIRIYRATENGKTVAFGVMYWILPITGFNTKYKVLNKSGNIKFKVLYKLK